MDSVEGRDHLVGDVKSSLSCGQRIGSAGWRAGGCWWSKFGWVMASVLTQSTTGSLPVELTSFVGRERELLALAPAPTPTRAMAMWAPGIFSLLTGQFPAARSQFEEVRLLCEQTGIDREWSYAVRGLGMVHGNLGEIGPAIELLTQARERVARVDDPWSRARILSLLPGLRGCHSSSAGRGTAAGRRGIERGRAERPRARGGKARRARNVQPRDRRRAVRVGGDGQDARVAHPDQARAGLARAARGLGRRTRPRSTHPGSVSATPARRQIIPLHRPPGR